MAHSFTLFLSHVVFSTKERRPWLDDDVRPDLCSYLGGITRELGGCPVIVNGVADHVHLLLELPATLAPADAVRVLKTNSSRWLHETRTATHRRFAWQTGYGAFSVSHSARGRVERYVAGQAEHHRERTFETEFIALLERHRVKYDPRFVFG